MLNYYIFFEKKFWKFSESKGRLLLYRTYVDLCPQKQCFLCLWQGFPEPELHQGKVRMHGTQGTCHCENSLYWGMKSPWSFWSWLGHLPVYDLKWITTFVAFVSHLQNYVEFYNLQAPFKFLHFLVLNSSENTEWITQIWKPNINIKYLVNLDSLSEEDSCCTDQEERWCLNAEKENSSFTLFVYFESRNTEYNFIWKTGWPRRWQTNVSK